MFADDLILFGQANEVQMQCVLEVLNTFCQLSGQHVSNEKTSILFLKNVDFNTRKRLVELSTFRETTHLGKYLGVPLIGRAPKGSDYQYLLDKVKAKLTSWKAKNLSLAGRVTLAKSIIQVIPVFPMMTASIPRSVLQGIQKM